ncbi:MAG: hypothetical protein GC160_29200 [Acidobacteria bacterium]|nr:hypothetical protein [Acidobacteriota bacterium]
MSVAIAENYIAAEHVAIFQEAARRWDVYILVRQSNAASKEYIGQAGYTPKRLDCKAKTAKEDLPPYRLAGLVVNPHIHPDAFRGRNLDDVKQTWDSFAEKYLWAPGEGEQPRLYLPQGKLYTLQLDKAHKHYGCAAFTKFGLATRLEYIYGDYDLYGIVSAQDPSNNVFVQEFRLHQGLHHARGREFFDVQHYLNRRMGVAMVLHGSQEKYSAHTDEDIVVFWPDGRTITECHGLAEIEALYREQFQGRKTGGKGMPTQPHFGQWKRV